MKVAIVYHRIDFDGICSMAVVRQEMEKMGNKVSLIGYNYNDETPQLDEYDLVFVVDATLPVQDMKRLDSQKKLVWIDHHHTSIQDSETNGYAGVPGLRREGVGACELCWEYCHPGVSVPPFIVMLSAYDVWDKVRLNWETVTLPFQYGMRNRYNLDAEAFYRDFINDNERYETICVEGRAILKYVRQTGAIACRTYGFEVTFGGVKALCLITPTFGGLAMEESARERGCEIALCVNRVGDGAWKISGYACNGNSPIDIGSYMKKHFHGGGHQNAAGGMLTQAQFNQLLNKKIL